MGSYPNPLFPLGFEEIDPSTLPLTHAIFFSKKLIDNAQINLALIFLFFQFLSFFSNSL